MNLLKETIKILERNRVSPNDVCFVTDGKSDCGWKEFADNANFEYYEGYGGQEVNCNLKIVGKDWWMERHEYDGSEWWEFKQRPMPSYNKKLPELKEVR